MTTTIRETENFEMFEDIEGNIGFVDKIHNSRPEWFVGTEARNKINYVKHLSDLYFDKYCSQIFSNHCFN